MGEYVEFQEMIMSRIYTPYSVSSTNDFPLSITEVMHSSSIALRPRQRTSTSCTECKRRKQKCNKAKDRPCNNCARRYPPVACTYRSSSREPTIERVVDLQEETSSRDEQQPSSSLPTTYQPSTTSYASQADGTAHASQEDPPPTLSHPFYAPVDLTTNYWQQQDDPWKNQSLASSTSSSSLSGGYYQPHEDYGYYSYPNYTTAAQDHGGYYSSAPPAGSWLSTSGDPSAFVGTGTAYDALSDLPIDSSRRNAELFHFFHQCLAPFLVTIDGKDAPAAFYGRWTPWIVQSPLMSTVTIISASYYQSEIRGLEVAKSPETMAIQGKIISVLNEYLKKTNLKNVSYDAIAAVMYLAINEWYFGDDASFWAHMKGMKEMVTLQGGLESMPGDSLLLRQIIITDYQIACCFERDLFLLNASALELTVKAPAAYPTFLENPLLQSGIRFVDLYSALNISQASAKVLDDMKFLTISILNLQTKKSTPEDLLKFQATALWTHNRVSALPSSPLDSLYETFRLIAVIYSAAIQSRQPLSTVSTSAQVQELTATMWRVSLTRWKKIPGILLWCILVACPCPTKDRLQKKFLKMMISTVAMHIGVENHDVAVACMKNFLSVQKWIRGSDEEKLDALEDVKGKGRLLVPVRARGSRSPSGSARGSSVGDSSPRIPGSGIERSRSASRSGRGSVAGEDLGFAETELRKLGIEGLE